MRLKIFIISHWHPGARKQSSHYGLGCIGNGARLKTSIRWEQRKEHNPEYTKKENVDLVKPGEEFFYQFYQNRNVVSQLWNCSLCLGDMFPSAVCSVVTPFSCGCSRLPQEACPECPVNSAASSRLPWPAFPILLPNKTLIFFIEFIISQHVMWFTNLHTYRNYLWTAGT